MYGGVGGTIQDESGLTVAILVHFSEMIVINTRNVVHFSILSCCICHREAWAPLFIGYWSCGRRRCGKLEFWSYRILRVSAGEIVMVLKNVQ